MSGDELMLAAQYDTSGPQLGELRLVELPRPQAAAGEVLVRLRISGVNPTDVRARSGRTFDPGHAQVVPGHDGAGDIVAVGDGVPAARVGERVWLYLSQWRRAQGTAAQWIALPSEQAVALPDAELLDLGAGLGIPALTAHRCLFAAGPIDAARVFVAGGAGAVGHAAIELACWGGARVATTVSSDEKAALAREAGAELVVNYRTEDAVGALRAWAPDGVQRIVEVAIAHNLELDAELLEPHHEISSYGAPDKPIELPRTMIAKNGVIRFVLVYTMPEASKRQAVEDVIAALSAGALSALPAVRFPLEQIAAAHEAVREHAVGKVLVDIP
jgi:NADPH2:quinone reductase